MILLSSARVSEIVEAKKMTPASSPAPNILNIIMTSADPQTSTVPLDIPIPFSAPIVRDGTATNMTEKITGADGLTAAWEAFAPRGQMLGRVARAITNTVSA